MKAIAEKVLNIARGELGTQESPKNSNNVKYNTWYYGREVYDGLWNTVFPWCMAFVQWCFMMAGVPLPFKTASCNALLKWYKTNKPHLVSMTPTVGAIVIYNFGHTGIVEAVNADGTITAIEGNTGNSSQNNGGEVMRKTRSVTLVTSFIVPFEIKEEKKEETEMTGEEIYRKLTEYLNTMPTQKYAEEASRKGIASGIFKDGDGDGLVDNPRAPITRQDLAVVLDRLGELG